MEEQAWVVAVDMGYGHMRAAHPLRRFAPDGKILIANNYPGIPKQDQLFWSSTRRTYEFFSRLNSIPLIGHQLFGIMDHFQAIDPFYPRRDLAKPNLQLKQIYYLIHKGWGKDLVGFLNSKPIPLITTFFSVAFFAEEHGFKNDIYLVICDSDVSRTWVPMNPKKTRVKFLASCRRVVDRLREYGVRDENIFLTGFPLPEENIGDNKLTLLKSDVAERVINLDPEHRYRDKFATTLKLFLHDQHLEERHHHPLTLTFAVGGAGAQRMIAKDLIRSLKKRLLAGEINVNLVAGTRNDVYTYFKKLISENGLEEIVGKNLKIIFAMEKVDYFVQFNDALRTTDVLWTKPSELVFYSALGLPIIMAPSLGSQEKYNRTWLKTIGAGISQGDARYTEEWFFDWVNSGWLAEAAMSGFLDGRQFGVANIAEVVFHGVKEPTKNNSLL